MSATEPTADLMPVAEVAPFFDGWVRGWSEGYARGRADHEAESWPEACRIVNNAAESLGVADARRRPFTIPAWAGGQS